MKTVVKKPIKQIRPSALRKTLAFVLDLMIINLFIIPGFRGVLAKLVPAVGFREVFSFYNTMMSNPGTMTALTFVSILLSFYILLYFSLSEYIAGSTIGMAMLNMRVTATDNGRISLFKSLIRNIFCIPFFPFILIWIADPLFLVIKGSGQRMTEYFTKTMVVSD